MSLDYNYYNNSVLKFNRSFIYKWMNYKTYYLVITKYHNTNLHLWVLSVVCL